MNLLKKYNEIIARYRNGEFGSNNLTMEEILSKAGESELFEKMNLTEIDALITQSSGLSKSMFCLIKQQKWNAVLEMEQLEKELSTYNISQYYNNNSISDAELAKKLNLDVHYCKKNELPKDVEAVLCPSNDQLYNGRIMIIDTCAITKFSFIHEIIHYIRDVGVGQRVAKEYTRKIQGKTDSHEEQEINYLTAAVIMPLDRVANEINEYDATDYEKAFLLKMQKKYEQNCEAVIRRLNEVRNIMDYRNNYCTQ